MATKVFKELSPRGNTIAFAPKKIAERDGLLSNLRALIRDSDGEDARVIEGVLAAADEADDDIEAEIYLLIKR